MSHPPETGATGKAYRVESPTHMFREGMVLTGFSLIGKLSGFVREWLMAFFFGIGIIADALRIATDLVHSLTFVLVGSPVETAMVPILSRWRTRGALRASALLIRIVSLLAIVVSVLLAFTIGGFAAFITHLQAPAYGIDEARKVTLILRWIAPAIPLFVACRLTGYMLVSVRRFRTFAMLPLVLNIGQVIGILLVGLGKLPLIWLPVSYSAALATTLIGLFLDAKRRWPENVRSTTRRIIVTVTPFLRNLWPLLIIGILTQLRIFIDKRIVSDLGVGFIAALWYARFIIETPLNTAGIALIRIILPHFSEMVELNQEKEIARQFIALIDTTLWLLLPLIIFLELAAEPVATVIFGYGAFDRKAIIMTSSALLGAAPVLWTGIIYPLTNRIFNAFGRNKVILWVGIGGTAINISLAYILAGVWGLAGVPLAMGIAQLAMTLTMIPLLRLGISRQAYLRIAHWCGLAVLLYVALRVVPQPASPLLAILSTGLVILAGWTAVSVAVPWGRVQIRRIRGLITGMRSSS